MRIIKKITDFLFGKDPEIFDERGNVHHRISQKTWSKWKDKTKSDPAYNWRQHSGTKAPHNYPS